MNVIHESTYSIVGLTRHELNTIKFALGAYQRQVYGETEPPSYSTSSKLLKQIEAKLEAVKPY